MEPPRPRRSELDDLGERPRAALLREPEERDEDLRRRERVGQRAMARLARRAEEVREPRQREALAPPVQQAPGEPDRVDHRRGDPAPGQSLDGVVEEPDVEAGVVRHERRIAGEREKAAGRASSGARRCAQLGVAEPGERAIGRRQRDAGIDERLEGLRDLERLDPHGADLAHAVARRREAGRLEVEDDELGVLDERVGLRSVGEPDARAEPGETGVTVDDVGEQRVRERRGRALEREENARRLLATRPRPDARGSARRAGRRHRRTAASRSTVIEHMFVFKAKRKAALPTSWGGPS